jgi:hypothetical protein
MKRFITHISLFILPFVVGLILIFYTPYNKEYGYGYRKNVDCNTSWIYYRLFENPTPIDIAFMGTSHTGCGINDSLIETELSNKNIIKNVSNIAYCSKGRNIQYSLLKDLIKNKKPELIFLEITEEESKSSHKDFSYISDLPDVIKSSSIYNVNYIKDVYSAFDSRLNYFRNNLLNRIKIDPPLNHELNYSYVPFDFFADTLKLNIHKKYQTNFYKNKSLSFIDDIQFKYPKNYLNKILDLAKEHNIKVIFLYVPSFGWAIDKPLNYDYYKKWGEVWLPPAELFTTHKYWVDQEHFNYKGSTEFGKWIANKFSEKQENKR